GLNVSEPSCFLTRLQIKSRISYRIPSRWASPAQGPGKGGCAMGRLFLVRHARPVVDPARPPSEWDLDPAGVPLLEQFAGLPHWASACRIVSSALPSASPSACLKAGYRGQPSLDTVGLLLEWREASSDGHHAKLGARASRHPEEPAPLRLDSVAIASTSLCGETD